MSLFSVSANGFLDNRGKQLYMQHATCAKCIVAKCICLFHPFHMWTHVFPLQQDHRNHHFHHFAMLVGSPRRVACERCTDASCMSACEQKGGYRGTALPLLALPFEAESSNDLRKEIGGFNIRFSTPSLSTNPDDTDVRGNSMRVHRMSLHPRCTFVVDAIG